jgi:UDP-2,4-diacetamido-2,4,6-trideoxy-beta-L-altropyranose hydrolase
MSAPRVTFVTDAGGEAGLGHFKRCVALARALGARGSAVDMLVSGPPDTALASVAPGVTPTPLDWWGAPRRVLDAVAGQGVEAFVVDSYHADESLLAALRRAGLVVAIDDLADRPLPVDLIVNGAWHAERLTYRVAPETRRLLGPRYALLDHAFAEAPARVTAEGVERVLVTLGGSTPTSEMAAAVAAVRSALPQARLDVLGGLVAVAAAPAPGVTLHGVVPSLRPLLASADLAVTGGGMTLYECLATGTPTIAVCLADNQRPNLEHLGADGLVVPADFATLGATVARVAADRSLRGRLSAAGRRAIDGRGTERVADEIVHLGVDRRGSLSAVVPRGASR